MEKFVGSKWRCVGSHTEYDIWGYAKEVSDFRMTSSYLKYLKQKQEEKELNELKVLKNKLDYQYKTYGEVDDLDYNLYVRLIGKYAR